MHTLKERLHTMKKLAEKDKLTALYERFSHDDRQTGESTSIENQKGICQGDFHPKSESSRKTDSD